MKLLFEAVDYTTIYTRTFCTYWDEEGVGKWVKDATQNRGNVYGDVHGRDDWDGHDVGVNERVTPARLVLYTIICQYTLEDGVVHHVDKHVPTITNTSTKYNYRGYCTRPFILVTIHIWYRVITPENHYSLK